MPHYEPAVPARYTAPLLEALREQQPPWLDAVLAGIGLDRTMLGNAGATVTMARFDALLVAIAQRTGRDDLGFDLGQRISLGHHGALVAVLQRCATLDDMLSALSRYSRLITPSFFLHYRRHADRADFIWRPAAPMSPWTLRAMEEVFAVSFHVQVGSVLARPPRKYDIYLSMPAPRHVARYRELRPARFHFGHQRLPEVRIVMDRELLGMRLLWPESGSLSTATPELGQPQRGNLRAARCCEWIAMMLREAEGTQPTLEELAELLSVSARTLTRYLASEGLTFRGLSNDVRQQRACEMLADRHQSIAEIAWRLGYGDQTNFSHAFRRASGRTPRDYRALS